MDASTSQFLFISAEHPGTLLGAMKVLRDRQELCDITLCAGEQEFLAHRIVLAACSPYFSAMFTNGHLEREQRRVVLNGVDSVILENLIEFAYTASLEIREDNVQNLLVGASLLQLMPVVEACCEFLKVRLDPENCLGMSAFAEMHGCADLYETSWRYTLENFQEVAKTEEFLNMPPSFLIELIRSEDLIVKTEEEVLDCVLRWFRHDELARRDSVASVLQYVKLPLISWTSLCEKLLLIDSISSDPDCQLLLTNAKNYQSNPESVESSSDSPEYCQYVPRKSVGQSLFVYVVGGETNPGRSTVGTVEQFEPAKNMWRELPAMDTSRRGVGIGLLSGLLYTVGGSDGVHALRLVECYDPHSSTWSRVADMNEERSSVAATVMNGCLYAIGGYDGIMSCLKTVEKYDPAADTWTYISEMSTPRSMMCVAALNNKLFAVGGYDGSSDLASCEMYDPSEDCWVTIEEMHSRRCMAGVGVVGGHLYAVGGCDCSQSLASIEAYDPQKNQWTLLAEMAELRSGLGVAIVGKKLYAVGGYTGSDYCSSVECYDPETNTWCGVASMRSCRRRFGCCS